MTRLVSLFLSPLGRAGLGVVGVVVIVALFASHQRSVGAKGAVEKIQRADNAAAQAIREADARSRRGASSGGLLGQRVRDPNAVSQ